MTFLEIPAESRIRVRAPEPALGVSVGTSCAVTTTNLLAQLESSSCGPGAPPCRQRPSSSLHQMFGPDFHLLPDFCPPSYRTASRLTWPEPNIILHMSHFLPSFSKCLLSSHVPGIVLGRGDPTRKQPGRASLLTTPTCRESRREQTDTESNGLKAASLLLCPSPASCECDLLWE